MHDYTMFAGTLWLSAICTSYALLTLTVIIGLLMSRLIVYAEIEITNKHIGTNFNG